ncbi:JAB domain-containing protein [Alicyclobacillus ferrooxydans]|uniref:DNA repair protein RadC n=1 Tax=Alicyclobacillus ferrooxydans TaxID=471514 RepID=A0A0P9CZU4_9BACL|nr:DNA repair protein RadC [Alicyclobacillus ferrooxydans]KPV42672.1 DNA repair protein RadC [Alicyclobacillus ferrooxydans]
MENIDIVKVVMVKEGALQSERFQIGSSEDAVFVARRFLEGADREHFIVMMLDTKHYINAIHTVSIGSLDASIVHPREVFKAAILSNASGIICAHNHPSGRPDPSSEDRSITKRLVEAGRILGIDVVDHLIIGDPGHVSLRAEGYI